jgi:hypothetical protein
MLSLRYKWLQRGIRDYEYMQILKKQGRTDQVREVLWTVFKFEDVKELYTGTAGSAAYSVDPADFDQIYAL